MPRKTGPRKAAVVYEPPIYTFRIRIRGGAYAPENGREVTRDVENAANQTLETLASAIISAYEFDHDHLWSFYLSGKAWDPASEYALDMTPNPFDAVSDTFGLPKMPKPQAAVK